MWVFYVVVMDIYMYNQFAGSYIYIPTVLSLILDIHIYIFISLDPDIYTYVGILMWVSFDTLMLVNIYTHLLCKHSAMHIFIRCKMCCTFRFICILQMGSSYIHMIPSGVLY